MTEKDKIENRAFQVSIKIFYRHLFKTYLEDDLRMQSKNRNNNRGMCLRNVRICHKLIDLVYRFRLPLFPIWPKQYIELEIDDPVFRSRIEEILDSITRNHKAIQPFFDERKVESIEFWSPAKEGEFWFIKNRWRSCRDWEMFPNHYISQKILSRRPLSFSLWPFLY